MHSTRRRGRSMAAAALAVGLAVSAAGPASAGAEVHRDMFPTGFAVPVFDDDFHGAVLINIDREAECTDEFVAWERAMVQWYEAGNEGEFPVPPPEDTPTGTYLAPWTHVVLPAAVGADVVLRRSTVEGLPAEMWSFHDGIEGPADTRTLCLDTEGGERVATGTGGWRFRDNDLVGSGSRGNAWSEAQSASLTGADGTSWTYRRTVHSVVNGTGELVADRVTEDLSRS